MPVQQPVGSRRRIPSLLKEIDVCWVLLIHGAAEGIGGGQEEEKEFIQNRMRASGAIPNEMGPRRCRVTQALTSQPGCCEHHLLEG